MNTLKTIALSSLLLVAVRVQAQINIPVADVSLDIPLGSDYIVTLNLNNNSRQVYVDPFKITSSAGSPITGITPSTITAAALWFCMDPLQTIEYKDSGVGGDLVYQSQLPANFNKYTEATVAQLGNGGGLNSQEIKDLAKLFAVNYIPAETSILKAAALQIAVWEVVNESNDANAASSYQLTGGSAGNFSITAGDSTLITTAQNMLNAIAGTATPKAGALDYLIDGTYTNPADCTTTVVVQDLVGWCPPIPESSNFAVGALGLLGAAVVFKLRSRKLSPVAPAA
jgi:hypothetical protein